MKFSRHVSLRNVRISDSETVVMTTRGELHIGIMYNTDTFCYNAIKNSKCVLSEVINW